MHKIVLMCGIGVFGACVGAPDDAAGAATSVATSYGFSYRPMGFARITPAGSGCRVATGFDSASNLSSAVTVSCTPGHYAVNFAGLGTTSGADGDGGQAQVTAEGTDNTRCRVMSWGGSTNLTVNVECNTPGGTAADSPFAVLYYRSTQPSSNTQPANAAYTWRPAGGAFWPYWDYNSSGTHNSVTTLATGQYRVTIPHATFINASMMVTAYNGTSGGAVCGILGWGSGYADVECRNSSNQLVDSGFSFSYATTGPTIDQQGAHAWFNGTSADPSYSAALGKVTCSPASVTGSRSGSLVTIIVSGDLGSWDASPFLRASLSSGYGGANYCKVETLTVSGVAPNSTATTTLRCYDAAGTEIAAPRLTFTHVTSDASGPC
ncbi:MAG: hypothetical protein E6J90_23515 [Deltaproteobacteria bacterium]|nr:MAG: hypothetical protein E6J91_42785 [Deltaproteobacteria bacterium]TMQ16574.1 MAG: hypothetical protein E6J90_23515 [Deltaproteobacteria bacterium]